MKSTLSYAPRSTWPAMLRAWPWMSVAGRPPAGVSVPARNSGEVESRWKLSLATKRGSMPIRLPVLPGAWVPVMLV